MAAGDKRLPGSNSMYQPFVYEPPTPTYNLPDGQKTTDVNYYNQVVNAGNAAKGGSNMVPGVGTVADPSQYTTQPKTQLPQSGQGYDPQMGNPGTQGNNQGFVQGSANSFQPSLGRTATPQEAVNMALQNPTAAKYKSAFAKFGGKQAPQDTASGRMAVDQATSQFQPTYTPPPPVVQTIQSSLDPYMQAMKEYFSPQSQRESLVDTYNSLSSSLNVPGLQAELLNDKRIMNGTEDDIRSEITKAGGFATESQVQAMVVARNKNLIKNAQFVQDQLTSAQDQLNTMVGLAGQDRSYALQQSNQAFDMFTKGLDYQQTMYKNSIDNDKFNVGQIGYVNYANSLDDTGKKLAGQRLFNDPSVFFDQSKLAQLETFRQKQLELNAAKTNITIQNQNQPVDDNVLSGMVDYYKKTGQLPPFGLGQNSPLRKAFFSAIGSDSNIINDASSNKAALAGYTKALSTQQNLRSATASSLTTLDSNLKMVDSYSNKVDRSGSPLFNKYLLYLKGQVKGDDNTAAFQNVIKTTSLEFGKIISGSSASISGVTVSSAQDAEDLLNASQTPGQLKEIMTAMKQEANNRLNGYDTTINDLQTSISNIGKDNQKVEFNGQKYDVGTIIANSKGQRGRIESNGSVTLLQ